jgi:hypothetical protein
VRPTACPLTHSLRWDVRWDVPSPTSPTQLGALKPREHLPSEGHLTLCASLDNIERQTGSSHALSVVRNNENPPVSIQQLVFRTRLVAAPLLGILERLLAAPALSDAASRHSLFGGSSPPSRPPLLSFPTRLICTVLRYHSPFTSFTNTHDSRYSPFAIL